MQRDNYIGLAALSFAQVCIGINIVMAKMLVAYMPILLLLSLRFLISCAILTVFSRITGVRLRSNLDKMFLTKKDWLVLFSQSLCAGLLFNIFMLNGLKLISASIAGIVGSMTVPFIVIFSCLFLKEKLKSHQLVAIFFAVIGLIVLNFNSEENSMRIIGIGLILCAIISESLFTVIAKWHCAQLKPLAMASIVSIFNALLFLPFFIYHIRSFPLAEIPLNQWAMLCLYGMLDGLFYFLWFSGLTKIRASIAAIFTCIMPLSVLLLAAIFLNEKITTTNFLGAMLVILSILIGANIFNFFSERNSQSC